MKANKLPAGSVKKSSLRSEMNTFCYEKFSAKNLVKAIHEYQVYLDTRLIDSLKLDIHVIKKALVEFLELKTEVIAAFDYDSFEKVVLPKNKRPLCQRVQF